MNDAMIVAGLNFGIDFVVLFFDLLRWGLILYIVISWIRPPANAFVRFVMQLGRMLCAPFEWARLGILSFAPIAAFIALDWSGSMLVRLLQAGLESFSGSL
jgi:uncharacterized protein YggT (Ycf19 family)